MNTRTTATTLDLMHAMELYALERNINPALPAWEDATWMTRSRFLRAACQTPTGRVA